MKRKGLLVIIGAIFYSIFFLNKISNIDKEVKLKDIEGISFITMNDTGNIVYTKNGESYRGSFFGEKRVGNKIIDKIKAGKKSYYIIDINGKKGLLDKHLKRIEGIEYDSIKDVNKRYFIVKESEKNYLINIESREKVGPFDKIVAYDEGKLFKLIKGEQIVFKDGDLKELNDLVGYDILYAKDGKVVLVKDGLYDLYDIEKRKVMTTGNREIFFSSNNILVKKDDGYYYNNQNLAIKRVIPSLNSVLICEVDKGLKFFDIDKGRFSKEIYSEISPNYDENIIIGKNGKYTVRNKHFYEIIDRYEYDFIERVGANSFAVGKDGNDLFALIVDSKKVTEDIYDGFIEINRRNYLGEKDGRYILLSKTGIKKMEINKGDLIYYTKELIVVKENEKYIVHSLKEEK